MRTRDSDLAKLFQLRDALDPTASAIAATAASGEDKARIEAACFRIAATGDHRKRALAELRKVMEAILAGDPDGAPRPSLCLAIPQRTS